VHHGATQKSSIISQGLRSETPRSASTGCITPAEQLPFGNGQGLAESIEEMEHADKFTDRILFLDGFPNMQVLDPLRIGQNVKEIIECDLASEIAARVLYQEAATHCHAVKDYVSRDLFEQLMKDEEHHIDFLETQLDLINRIGLEL
jgi:bacterioferritin